MFLCDLFSRSCDLNGRLYTRLDLKLPGERLRYLSLGACIGASPNTDATVNFCDWPDGCYRRIAPIRRWQPSRKT